MKAVSPRSLGEALGALAENPSLTPVAGGTDLLVTDAAGRAAIGDVLDVSRIPELHGIREDERQRLEIGGATTFTEIGNDPRVIQRYPALRDAAQVVGGWQIQNRATLAGNMANASPAGDSLPALLALDAIVLLAGPNGHREVAYEHFHEGYRKTAVQPGELIVSVILPPPPPSFMQGYTKVGTREAQAISKVVVAFSAGVIDGELIRVRFAAGSVAATPIRLQATEAFCEHQVLSETLADQAGLSAANEVQPIDDVRSTAEYRSHVLGRVVRRLLLNAIA